MNPSVRKLLRDLRNAGVTLTVVSDRRIRATGPIRAMDRFIEDLLECHQEIVSEQKIQTEIEDCGLRWPPDDENENVQC